MGSIIKIKRSSSAGTPAILGQGEMAYSYAAGTVSTLGDRLFIGTGTETAGNAAVHSAVGGLYYTRLIDASVPGTLTTSANSVPVLSSTGTIDKWYAGNTYIYNNVISTTGSNEDLVLDPAGTGTVKINSYKMPIGAGTNNYILKTNGSDTADWAAPTTYIGSTAVNLFNSSGDVSAITNLNLNGGNYSANYVKVSDVGFGPALGTTNSDSAVRIETGASGTVNHLWTFNANGTTSFNNASYTFPASDGTANYYLKTNGSGVLSWASAATNLDSVLTAGNSSTQDMTVGNVTVSSLNTNESVVFTNSSGKLINSSNFTYDTDATILHVGDGMFNGQTGNSSVKVKTLYSTSLTSTRVPYAGTDSGGTKLQDSANFTWDNSNQVLKIGAGGSEIGGDAGYGYVKAADVQTGKITNNGHTWLFNANGSTTFNSAYTLPAADGTGGYILKTYGNGVVYWSSATAAQIQADYTQTDTGAVDYIKNKPTLANVATSGQYSDLSGTPTLATVATSGQYSDLSGTPSLATVATSGLYSDLSGTPSLATVATSGLYSDLSGTPSLATVATSGDYNDLINTPDTAAYLNVSGDSGTGNVSLNNDTVDFVGIAPLNFAISKTSTVVSVTANIANASTTGTIGVSTFDGDNFSITNAKVSLKAGGITNASLANANVIIGSTTVNLGSTVTAFAGLTSLQVGNIKIYSDNQITSQETNGNINLITNGTGVIDVHNTRISGVADPTGPYDAANRSYVDAVANGFHVHMPAQVATHANLATITGGTVTYNNGTDGVGATLTLGTAITAIDGITYLTANFPDGSRILVKDEATAAHNGIYTINTAGTILTRATDFDTAVEVGGGDFVFVEHGDVYGSTGWVQVEDTDIIGTHAIVFSQFAGVGTYKAGIGLYLDGTTFNANVNSSTGGIEVVANQFQLKSTLAGNGLTYTTGVLNIGGTSDRITISSDAIDIAATYIGQSSITTLGNITTGTWSGNTIGVYAGGTGIASYSSYDLLVGKSDGTLQILSKGTGGQILQMNSAGTALLYADLDGGTY